MFKSRSEIVIYSSSVWGHDRSFGSCLTKIPALVSRPQKQQITVLDFKTETGSLPQGSLLFQQSRQIEWVHLLITSPYPSRWPEDALRLDLTVARGVDSATERALPENKDLALQRNRGHETSFSLFFYSFDSGRIP